MNNSPDRDRASTAEKSKASRRRTLVVEIAPLATTILATVALLSLVSARWGWRFPFELFAHFQLQYFLGSSLCLVVVLLTRRQPWLWLSLGFFALQSSQILPWYLPAGMTFGRPGAADTGESLRVLVANVSAQNRSYAAVRSLVEQADPDLAIFMEVDEDWQTQLDSLNAQLPYHMGQALPFYLGLLVYSKQPLQNPRVELFGTEQNISLLGTLSFNDRPLSLIATHPLPPIRADLFHHRNQQLFAIGEYARSLAGPVLLAGDFNVSLWSPYYRQLERRSRLHNARRGFGILPTWSPLHPSWMLSLPIDHALVSKELVATRVEVGPDIGSDHRPLIADLRWR